jgi:2-polyprenyl-6-hydroxyphenyl methylase/3-demethylubiquinone-9 3-methyltransferase
MFPAPIQSRETACKCCGAAAQLYGVCDFAKMGRERFGELLPRTGIPIYYYRCAACGFIFTTQFDQATHDELTRHVYNDEYVRAVDLDYASARPESNANFVNEVFGEHKHSIAVLDYGGGNGLLASRLRELGFPHVETYDPFSPEFAARPTGKFNLVLSFEVVEHVPAPLATFQDMVSLLDASRGVLLFSTLLLPEDIDAYRVGWWYIAPRNGHISIHTLSSLAAVLGKCGLRVASANSNLHCAFREIPDFARHFVTPAT